jgi:hypothetical protein
LFLAHSLIVLGLNVKEEVGVWSLPREALHCIIAAAATPLSLWMWDSSATEGTTDSPADIIADNMSMQGMLHNRQCSTPFVVPS